MPSSVLRLTAALLVAAAVATTVVSAAADGLVKPPVYVRFDFTGLIDGAATASAVFEVRPDWAPVGAARFLELVEDGFFNDIRFFRVVNKFVAQFGISGDPAISAKWRAKSLKDDPVTQPNRRGTISFATSGANTRTTQLFINLVDNAFLDKMGFAPIGRFVDAGAPMPSVVDRIYKGAGERPQQGLAQSQGNAYLGRDFPKLSAIASATVVSDPAADHQSANIVMKADHHDDAAETKAVAASDKHHHDEEEGAEKHDRHGDGETARHHGHHGQHHHDHHHNHHDEKNKAVGVATNGGGGTGTGHHAGPGLLVLVMGGLGAAGALLVLLRRRNTGRQPPRPLLPRSA